MTDAQGKRVLMLTDYFYPHIGGVEGAVAALGRRLTQAGHEVHVLTLNVSNAAALETMDGITIHRAGALELTQFTRMQNVVSGDAPWQLLQLVRRLNPDVIHAHSLFFFTSLVAACLRPLLGKPLVTTIHSGAVDCLSGAARLAATLYQKIFGRFVLQASDRVIAVSEAVADHATRIGCPPGRISVIPNGVELERFGSAPQTVREDDRSRVVVVGRLIPNKGPQYLVDAAPAILARHPRTEFVFVGDGPLRKHLEAAIAARSLTSAFTFLGLRDDVPAILRGASMLVLPSLSEGMPLTVLEAMASGLPVVATTVGGTKEVVRHGTTGFLVKPGCPEELEKAICCVLANPGRAWTMGDKGRRVVERDHDWGQVADRTLELYEKIIASSREEVAGPLGAKLSA